MFLKITQFVVLIRFSYALFKIKNLVDKMVNFIVYEFYLNLAIKGEKKESKEGMLSLVRNGV